MFSTLAPTSHDQKEALRQRKHFLWIMQWLEENDSKPFMPGNYSLYNEKLAISRYFHLNLCRIALAEPASQVVHWNPTSIVTPRIQITAIARMALECPYPEPVVFQWQSRGNPVCLELRPQCTLECHWRNAGVLPVVFQWSSSGFPVVFQCDPIMQINTGSPLEHHWVLASASVVPVTSQCTCGSSGLPVWSVQWYPSVLTEYGLEVIRSGHFPACDPLCIQLVWWELFELNWFHLTCNPKYTKTIMVLISKACTEWYWSTHMC